MQFHYAKIDTQCSEVTSMVPAPRLSYHQLTESDFI